MADLVARFGRPLLPVLVVTLAGILGVLRGPGTAILLLAGAVLVLVISLLWQSLRVLVGDAPLSLEATMGLLATSTEDGEKRAVLRALKDLDYERSVGKLTEEDYLELSTRYRA